jgi:hypothetical protein
MASIPEARAALFEPVQTALSRANLSETWTLARSLADSGPNCGQR